MLNRRHEKTPRAALVRDVPDSFAAGERTWIERAPIDLDHARRAHAEYVDALHDAGLTILRVPADEAHPDCPFVEDVLIEVGGHRILTRPGASSRRGERGAVAAMARPHEVMPEDVRLDGGDVLQVGGRVLVGVSTRTDTAAVSWLTDRIPNVIAVDLGAGRLHLKTVASTVGPETVMTWRPELFDGMGLRVIALDPRDEAGANVLLLPDRSVVLPSGTPKVEARLEDLGLRVRPMDLTPFQAAEAGPTCLSVLLSEVP